MRIDGSIEQDAARAGFYLLLAAVLGILVIRFRLFPGLRGGLGGPWTIFQKRFWQRDDATPIAPFSRRTILSTLVGLGILHLILDVIF